MTEQYRLLAAVIAAHPNREVAGRTRLQKTIKLLQRIGLSTSYGYSIHFYGPYSEDLHSDLTLLKNIQLATEESRQSRSGDSTYYLIHATEAADSSIVKEFQWAIDIMAKSASTVLELAATYDAFREEGNGEEDAMVRLRRKKGSKCDNGNDRQALILLRELKLLPS